MKNLLKFTFLFLMTVGVVSCGDDDEDRVTPPALLTIADFVATNANYSSLAAALEVAGLTATLDGTDEFTVFAPNNDAFAAFLNVNGFASLSDVPVPALTNILLNHVILGKNESGDLSQGYVNSLATYGTTTNNLSLFLDLTDGVRVNGVSSVSTADVEVTNGVIHAVDAVIGLPTVVTFATADSTFSSLAAALTRDDQPDYVTVLSSSIGNAPAPFTVFAPTNTAFENVLTELGLATLADIPTATLTATLNTHVIAGVNVRAEDLVNIPAGPIETLGDDILIDAANATITDQNGRVSQIIVTNVQAANGVIHAIDTVLLPN